jgi:uncharacterized protein involved in exopolysaccharide biosynthesis
MAREIQLSRPDEFSYLTPRDFVSAMFHHRRLVLGAFAAIFGATLLFAIFRRPLYSSQMSILVNLERTDPVVTTDPNTVQRTLPGITEEEVGSEMELLRSQDLLRGVVVACNLQSLKEKSVLGILKDWLEKLTGKKKTPEDVKIAKAVRELQGHLVVGLIPKSTLISVSYTSPDPELSAKVLQSLSDLYLQKHLAVRRPAGTFEFFKQEADRSHAQLKDAERSLENFTRENHVASVDAEKDATLKKLTELEVSQHETEASIEIANQRIRTLNAQMAKLPPRLTTQVRKASGRPPDQLQSTLLTLELKRTELLGIFQPDYPAVKEVEKQIADANAALATSQERTVVEETTDRDPTYEWLRSELEKAKVDLVDLQSRERTIVAMIGQFSEKARRLNNQEVRQADLARSVKTAEDTYLTYQKKQEEARISDALDRRRILNVAIADMPIVPVLPSSLPSSIVLLIGLVLASVVSGGMALGAERMNASFRTPQDVEKYLEVPVVAALPERLE